MIFNGVASVAEYGCGFEGLEIQPRDGRTEAAFHGLGRPSRRGEGVVGRCR